MGTWAAPDTAAKVEELAVIMSAPLAARDAPKALYGVIGDDEVFDAIALAAETDDAVDVRSLVLLKLDEWLHRTPDDAWVRPWEPDVRKRVAEIFEEGMQGIEGGDILFRLTEQATQSRARETVAKVLGLDDEKASRLEVLHEIMPGNYAVPSIDGRLFHIEGIHGTVTEVPAELIESHRKKLDQVHVFFWGSGFVPQGQRVP